MFEKMSQGTTSFFGKTKDVLMPWSKSSKKPSSSKSHKPAKKSFFSSWFPEKKQQKESKTVKDFWRRTGRASDPGLLGWGY